MAHVLADRFQIEVLQAAVAGVVEKYHDEHHFRLRQCRITVIIALFSLLYGIFFHHSIKKLAEIVGNTKNSVTLSSVIIAIIVCETFDLHYKVTTIFANHQIFRQLYFVELTLA